MSRHSAPEVRGPYLQPNSARQGLATRFVLALFVLLAIHAPSSASDAVTTPARGLELWSAGTKPDFVLTDLDGQKRGLPANAQGLVLVHFFATWCETCRDELASLTEFARNQDVSVLAVDVGEVPGRVRRFLDGTPLNFPVLLDSDRAVTKAWAVVALPTTFVLDRNLVPRLFVEGDLDWTSADVAAVLASVAPEAANLHSLKREKLR